MASTLRSQPESGEFRRTVQVADSRKAEVIERLGRIVRAADLFEQNDEEMALPRPVSVRLTVHHPGGGGARFLVFSHYVCPEGMWFLHSGFLHPGTRCVIVLPRGSRQEGGVLGAVEHCEHLDRAIHAAALRFDSHVDPDLFQGLMGAVDAARVTEAVSLPDLKIRVLLLENQQSDNELVAFHLRSVGARLTSYGRVTDALGDIQNEGFDLVVTELNLDEGPGEQAIAAMRSAGYAGPILVLTSEKDVERLRKVRRDGAFAVVQKPYDPTLLIRTIASAVGDTAAPSLPTMDSVSASATRSAETARYTAEMSHLMCACVRRIEALCRDLALAGRSNDLDEAKGLLAMLGGSATSAVAQDDMPKSMAALRALLDDLGRQCRP